MALDAQTKAFLDRAADAGGPALHELPVPEARAMLKEITLAMDAPRREVRKLLQRTIPGSDADIPLRVYWPYVASEVTDPLPVLLLFHGGGFALGDLDTHENVARFYCEQAKVVVVSVDYRLAPEHKFPSAVEDCYDALCWTHENASSLGADPEKIAVTGDSAGGNLSAGICQLSKERRGPPIAFQALAYPVMTLDLGADYSSRVELGAGEYFLSLEDMKWFNSHYLSTQEDVRDSRASPILRADLAGLPPALIITAGYDPLRDEAACYAERLRMAGVDVEYHCFESTVHGFMSFSGAIEAGREGLEMVAGRVRDALKNKG